jgi:uncharacterized protein YdeI (YjbR/CyaY-like superfamily)
MVEITKRLYVATREEWRRWLEKNHNHATEIWLLFPKKASGKTRLPYDEAVEEALCFGWIDGIVKPIDEKLYAQRYSPRRPGSNWSELNRRRFAKMLCDGKITEAGMAKPPNKRERPATPNEIGDTVPAYIRKAMRENEPAWTNFRSLAPSYRRRYVFWINHAKKEETKQKRLREAIEALVRNKMHARWLAK